jgi:beta-1,2-mannobiose phosphorylase / 1,2-beta-oligomannan phosphorylase
MVVNKETEPPPELASLSQTHNDIDGILLHPNESRLELAVLNPTLRQESTFPHPILYRTRRTDDKGEFSTIDFTWLETPTKVNSESRVLIYPEHNYESRGCEDPRITQDLITYIATDGFNALPALAFVNDKFTEVDKKGLLGPNISMEEAIQLVDNDDYKKLWEEELHHKRNAKSIEGYESEILLYNKDASLHHNPKKGWVYIFRLEPDIQIAFANDWQDFQNKDFWRNYFKNFSKGIILKAGQYEKIGLGSPPTKVNKEKIALYHNVEPGHMLSYSGSFVSFDKNYRARAVLKDPLLKPDIEKDVLHEPNHHGELVPTKAVYFPTAMLQDQTNPNTLWIYSGRGDKNIGYRSTDISWLFNELSHPHNKEQ